jgi:hypothetical protein
MSIGWKACAKYEDIWSRRGLAVTISCPKTTIGTCPATTIGTVVVVQVILPRMTTGPGLPIVTATTSAVQNIGNGTIGKETATVTIVGVAVQVAAPNDTISPGMIVATVTGVAKQVTLPTTTIGLDSVTATVTGEAVQVTAPETTVGPRVIIVTTEASASARTASNDSSIV